MTQNNPTALKIDPQFKPKVGVFFNKDAKMRNLEERNKELKELLQKEVEAFQTMNKMHQENRSKISTL